LSNVVKPVFTALLLIILMAGGIAFAADDIFQTMGKQAQFTTTFGLFDKAGMAGRLSGPGPYTVFAPIENAYLPLTTTSMKELTDSKARLTRFAGYHIVPGKLTIDSLSRMSSITTVDGIALPVKTIDGITNVGNARVSDTGIECSNGIIYPIDNLLIPGVRPIGDYKSTSLNEYPLEPVALQPPETTTDWAIMIISLLGLSAIVIYLLSKALFGKRTEE
jgi:hypothetical protein